MKLKEGLIYVFCGDGKGKTSAALGTALRMLLNGKRVEWISWYKEESWKSAEMKMPEVFENNLKMHWMGEGFCGGPLDKGTLEGHKTAAKKALGLAREILSQKESQVNLLVMDEVLRAIGDGLLEVRDVINIVKIRGKAHLVLTGHSCPEEIRSMADLVTEMRKIKHPYDKGIMAVSGLDF